MYQATVSAEPLTSEVALLNGEPETRSGGWTAVTVGPKPSAPSAAVFELVTFRLAALSVCSVITPPLTVEGVEVPVIEIDLGQQRLDAVGDVELVAGRAGGDKGDGRAVDGDGVASREIGGERIRASGAGQRGRAGDRRRRRGLVVDRASRGRSDGSKKSCPASTAEAATSVVLASVPIAVFSAVFRLRGGRRRCRADGRSCRSAAASRSMPSTERKRWCRPED